jgi:adenosine deaminase
MTQDRKLDLAIVQRMPKVLLHEHLDGSLRAQTIIELARDAGYDGLPSKDPGELANWFFQGADRGSLPLYLEGFAHTIAVMQTPAALERVAIELLEDMALDNVAYVEVRFAPHFHTRAGLGLDAVMESVMRGLRAGRAKFKVDFGVIVCAMRNESAELSLKLAELTVAWQERGCVGFDLAGEEYGHPPKEHLPAFQLIKRSNGSITIHAGESFGPESIWQALQYCGAHRIGHGTRLIEDIVVYDQKVIRIGSLARYVLDHRIPIEVCLSSNVHTGATPSLAEHPFPFFLEQQYCVTLSTDNRLMSKTSMSAEYMLAVENFGCTFDELERISVDSIEAAFCSYQDRRRILQDTIQPGFDALRRELEGDSAS